MSHNRSGVQDLDWEFLSQWFRPSDREAVERTITFLRDMAGMTSKLKTRRVRNLVGGAVMTGAAAVLDDAVLPQFPAPVPPSNRD